MSDRDPEQEWIGVFQAEWLVQIHTLQLLNGLSDAGYHVDLFCYKTPFTHKPDDYCGGNIHVHILEPLNAGWSGGGCRTSFWHRLRMRLRFLHASRDGLLVRFWRRLRSRLRWLHNLRIRLRYENYLLFTKDYTHLIPKRITQRVIEIARGKKYVSLIGVEKLGMVWASQAAQSLHVPFLYYSLELYGRIHPRTRRSARLTRIQAAEALNCKNSAGIIIQDRCRAAALLREMQISDHPLIYLPVSLPGPAYTQRTNYLRRVHRLPDDTVLILQFGLVERYGRELVRLAQSLPGNYVLVLHDGCTGRIWNREGFLSDLRSMDVNHRVLFSFDDVARDRIHELVASADVGLTLYSGNDENDRLTVFSSEKLALYLQCGVPVIAFRYPGYELIEASGSGVLIGKIEDIPDAASTILEKHELFRKNAQKLFLRHYQFESHFPQVIQFLSRLAGERSRLQQERHDQPSSVKV